MNETLYIRALAALDKVRREGGLVGDLAASLMATMSPQSDARQLARIIEICERNQ